MAKGIASIRVIFIGRPRRARGAATGESADEHVEDGEHRGVGLVGAPHEGQVDGRGVGDVAEDHAGERGRPDGRGDQRDAEVGGDERQQDRGAGRLVLADAARSRPRAQLRRTASLTAESGPENRTKRSVRRSLIEMLGWSASGWSSATASTSGSVDEGARGESVAGHRRTQHAEVEGARRAARRPGRG